MFIIILAHRLQSVTHWQQQLAFAYSNKGSSSFRTRMGSQPTVLRLLDARNKNIKNRINVSAEENTYSRGTHLLLRFLMVGFDGDAWWGWRWTIRAYPRYGVYARALFCISTTQKHWYAESDFLFSIRFFCFCVGARMFSNDRAEERKTSFFNLPAGGWKKMGRDARP